MKPKTIKEIGDKSKCPKCGELKIHQTETDKYVEEWCSNCDYEYKYIKKVMTIK